MAQVFRNPNGLGIEPDLPALESLIPANSTAKDKMDLVLRLLRQAAERRRESKGRPFYSIRTVARHFRLPPTTVTRLYGQLKTEGVLGSIWGSKTIIEPVDMDKDIRLKAFVGLPVSLREFSLVPSYRDFFRLMQHTLWKQRFGSQLVFYENGFGNSSKFADTLFNYRVDVVIWLAPSSKMSNTVARLRDRGVRLITIANGLPINGDSGYYISQRDALIESLAGWKTAGIGSVIIVHEHQCTRVITHRMLHTVLMESGIPFCSYEVGSADLNELLLSNERPKGIIFESAQSIIQHAPKAHLSSLLQHNRVMFLEGRVDFPGEIHLSGSFDTIEFDWRTITRRIVSDLIANRCTNGVNEQTVFKAKWCHHIFERR